MEEKKDIFGYQLNQEQYQQIFQNNQELCSLVESIQTEYNNKGVQYFQTIREQLNSKIQSLYDVVKVDDYATKNIVNNQLRLAYYNVSKEYPYMIKVRGDGNCFYRSLIVGVLISISSHENSQYLRVLIRKLFTLESLMFQLKDESININERDVGLILARFFISILIAKNVHPKFNILQLLAEYNDFPEVDLSLNIFCRNIIYEYFDKHLKDPQYNEFIGDDMKNNIPFYLCYIGSEAEDVIIPLSANAFSYNITIQNIFIDIQEKIYQDRITYKPTVGEPLSDLILCYVSDHYNLLLNKEQSQLFQRYPPQVLLNSSSILKILKNERIIRCDSLKNNNILQFKEIRDQIQQKDNHIINGHTSEKKDINGLSNHKQEQNQINDKCNVKQEFIEEDINDKNTYSDLSKKNENDKVDIDIQNKIQNITTESIHAQNIENSIKNGTQNKCNNSQSINNDKSHIKDNELEQEQEEQLLEGKSPKTQKKISKQFINQNFVKQSFISFLQEKVPKEKLNFYLKIQQLNQIPKQKPKAFCFECKQQVDEPNGQSEDLVLCDNCYQIQSNQLENSQVKQSKIIELNDLCSLCQKQYNENEFFQSKNLCQTCVKIEILSNFKPEDCICCSQKATQHIHSLIYQELSVAICLECVEQNLISIQQDQVQNLKVYIKAFDVYTTFKMNPELIIITTEKLNNTNKMQVNEEKQKTCYICKQNSSQIYSIRQQDNNICEQCFIKQIYNEKQIEYKLNEDIEQQILWDIIKKEKNKKCISCFQACNDGLEIEDILQG